MLALGGKVPQHQSLMSSHAAVLHYMEIISTAIGQPGRPFQIFGWKLFETDEATRHLFP